MITTPNLGISNIHVCKLTLSNFYLKYTFIYACNNAIKILKEKLRGKKTLFTISIDIFQEVRYSKQNEVVTIKLNCKV